MIEHNIDRNFSAMRLDRFLRKIYVDESLSKIFSILRKKKVRVNGVIAKGNLILKEGDKIHIYENLKGAVIQKDVAKKNLWNKDKPKESSWNNLNFEIIFQNEDYLIVNKPSGMPSQPGSGTRKGESLVEKLWEWGEQECLDFKPTLAHRLDQETSGLLIVALHGDILRDFTRLIREHKIKKFYLALIKGNLDNEKGTIESSLSRLDKAKGSKMQIDSNGKKSITHYKVQKHYNGFDLVKINLETGRMHQIRAHFSSIGHPLLGDTRYGDFSLNRELKKLFELNRLFLHSVRLEFNYKNKNVVFEAPLPNELEKVLKKLESIVLFSTKF